MNLRRSIVAILALAVGLPTAVGVAAVMFTAAVPPPQRHPADLARMTARLLMQDLASTSHVFELGMELFDLSSLRPEETVGVLRLLYKQDPDLSVVVLLDGADQAIVDPVFLRQEQISAAGPDSQRHPMDEIGLGRFLKHLPIAEARSAGRALSDVYVDLPRHTALLAGAMVVPAGADQKPWLLGFERSLRSLQQNLTAGNAGDGARIFVVDDGGRVLIHPDGNLVLTRASLVDHPLVSSFLAGNPTGQSTWTTTSHEAGGERLVLGAYQKLDSLNWAVIVEQPQAPARSAGVPVWAMLAWILSLILVVLGAFYVRRVLAQGIRDAADKVRSFENREVDLKRMQASLLETRKLNAIGDLGAGVAHEFNNPLGGILGLTQLLLRKKAEDDPDRRFLLRIEAEAKRCKDITDNLLRFSEQQGSEHKEPVRVERVLDKAIDLIDSRLEEERIEIVRDFGQTASVVANEGKLQMAFLNLFLNAETAMPAGGTLTLATAQENATVLIRISDTGRGINRDNLQRVFEPFFTTKDNWKGAGLGLWVVYQIVQDHGGSVGLESEEGKGTHVTLRIPIELRDTGKKGDPLT